ncbi:cytochrome bc1 complex Rieske iron-sulfur subunit [Actinomycetospora lemnae]|uniref:Rieske iron-sulfur protein n=1 Tax=Actinomycetospora lemnae TaxID=3019891 RepID=A0ABT5SYV7_9PSEU|nr:ubiquinol-cytochrome c reductase iron-sulfur subunit [Actinomycetospora sp. DW7H6]MDD7968040.1 ubiquinol-cytochrome c reductase iron-sulfur subunit [Actinomycetospora sp. DW7H6]
MSEDGSTPPERELDRMDVHELGRLGARLDDVEIVDDAPRHEPGSREERRAYRRVAAWFVLTALGAVGFVLVFVLWPWQYTSEGPEQTLRAWFTPMLGITFAISVLSLAVGIVTWSKIITPEDVAVQQRHDGPSPPVAQRTLAARVVELVDQTGLGRSKLLRRTVLAACTAVAGVLTVTVLGTLVRDPWSEGPYSPLLTTGWRSPDGERTYLRVDTGDPHSVTLLRPEDVAAGGMLTVFPFRESMRGDPEALAEMLRAADVPVVIVRFFPGTPVVERVGQEDFHLDGLYAYSKICTHMGCPASLFEQTTLRILCPCHQTEFQANEYARPVFGPGARPLPQLPLRVDERGYLYAPHDFIEPIGPGFWSRDPRG